MRRGRDELKLIDYVKVGGYKRSKGKPGTRAVGDDCGGWDLPTVKHCSM